MMIILSILIILALALHLALIAGSVFVWNRVAGDNPAMLPRLFFGITAARLLLSVVFFALSMWLLYHNITEVRIFTVAFIVIYMLSLAFDTAYFYYSSNKLNK